MSVIFIGDRSVGKSQLVYTLAGRQYQNVEVTNLTQADLEKDPSFWLPTDQDTNPTTTIEIRPLEMKINLRIPVRVKASWMDTPGEIWTNDFQQNNPKQWDQLKQYAQSCQGVILLLPPHRDIVLSFHSKSSNISTAITDKIIQEHRLPNFKQWCGRFDLWVKFFLEHCLNANHIIICINKADLFCNIETESAILKTKDWSDRHTYIIDKYFQELKSAIGQINQYRNGLRVRCFITTKENRFLLELPWCYLGSYLK